MKYENWTLIDWDGTIDLKHKCWRKSFGKGHVSIGINDFLLVVYSYGANSENSLSSTRWNYENNPITEEEMKVIIDRNNGKYNSKDNGHSL